MEEDKATNNDGDNQADVNEPRQQASGQLVDDVRSPERPAVRSIKVDNASDDAAVEASSPDEVIQPSEPVEGDAEQESTDIEPQMEASDQAGVAQDSRQGSDADVQVGESTESAPTPESDEKTSSSQTGDSSENGDETSSGQGGVEDDIQAAASVPVPAAPAAQAGKLPGHKTSVGTLIVVITVALALIALAVVSYVMINSSSVDDSNSSASNTAQQENQAETPAEASQDVTQTSSEIDQTISELDGLDATTFDDSSLSDSTLGL